MSERYTRKDAERAFELLCKVTEHRQARAWNDVGGWQLDYNSAYGGYVVHEVVTASGGVSEPLGSMRRTARDFCQSVNFAVRAIGTRSQ